MLKIAVVTWMDTIWVVEAPKEWLRAMPPNYGSYDFLKRNGKNEKRFDKRKTDGMIRVDEWWEAKKVKSLNDLDTKVSPTVLAYKLTVKWSS